MDKDIEEFLKENPPKFKLKPYSNAILELLKQGCSQTQILKFLKEKKGVDCSRKTLYSHIKYLRKNSLNEEIEITARAEETTNENAVKNKKTSREELLKRMKGEK